METNQRRAKDMEPKLGQHGSVDSGERLLVALPVQAKRARVVEGVLQPAEIKSRRAQEGYESPGSPEGAHMDEQGLAFDTLLRRRVLGEARTKRHKANLCCAFRKTTRRTSTC